MRGWGDRKLDADQGPYWYDTEPEHMVQLTIELRQMQREEQRRRKKVLEKILPVFFSRWWI